MKSNIIELANYRKPEHFDFAAYNRRADERFRSSEKRAKILHLVETFVTASIGFCTLFCMYLTFTML